MSNRRRRTGGFTLLEVVVAFTILAVAMVGLMRAFSTGLRGLDAAQVSTAAVMHARSKLEEVGIAIPIEGGEQSGEFDDGYEWRVSMVPLEDPRTSDLAAPVLPYRVQVTVTAPGGRAFSLDTVRLGAFE
ncbi:MAG: prepilin-type N-terminal cleavage/methylation domain-containing protein [Kiloniellaceae bacterium]